MLLSVCLIFALLIKVLPIKTGCICRIMNPQAVALEKKVDVTLQKVIFLFLFLYE